VPAEFWLLAVLAALWLAHDRGRVRGWRECDRHYRELLRRKFGPWLDEYGGSHEGER